MKYALYLGSNYDSSEPIPANYSDDIEELLAQAAVSNEDWYEIVDVSDTPFKSVRDGQIYALREERCAHKRTYRIEPADYDGIIASGYGLAEGEYCRDCGTRLGD